MKRWYVAAVVLATLGIGGWQSAIENEVKQVETLVNARAIAAAINMYAADYDGIYPYPHDLKGLKWVTFPYVKDKASWKTLNPKKGEFRFNMSLGGVAKADVVEPGRTVLIYESNEWPNRRRAVSFVDGSGKILNPIEWGQHAATLATRLERKAERLPAAYGKQWKE